MESPVFPPQKQIRNLLMVVFCAVAFSFLLTGLVVYFYGPSGQYLLGNALVSPQIIPDLVYNDTNSKTGGNSRFVFDGIEFFDYDSSLKEEKQIPISLDTYTAIYGLIKRDLSVAEPDSQIFELFQPGNSASLVIKVRTESHADWQDERKIFETVTFLKEGDYYRVHLHEEKNPNQWVYFYHPKIYQKIAALGHLNA
jgi:hypothetical protein